MHVRRVNSTLYPVVIDLQAAGTKGIAIKLSEAKYLKSQLTRIINQIEKEEKQS